MIFPRCRKAKSKTSNNRYKSINSIVYGVFVLLCFYACRPSDEAYSQFDKWDYQFMYKNTHDILSTSYKDFYVVDTLRINQPMILSINNEVSFVSSEENINAIVTEIEHIGITSLKRLNKYLDNPYSSINSPYVFLMLKPEDPFEYMYALDLQVAPELRENSERNQLTTRYIDDKLIVTIANTEIRTKRFNTQPSCFVMGLVSVRTFSKYWNSMKCPPLSRWSLTPLCSNQFNNYLTILYPKFEVENK